MGYSRRQGGSYEGRRGHGKGFKRFPVELGEELEVDIKELSPKAEGIARSSRLRNTCPQHKAWRPRENKDHPDKRQSSKRRNNQIDSITLLKKQHNPKLKVLKSFLFHD